MGVYRSVLLDLACQRCGAAHRAEVQFKTGRDRCEDYEVGERVEDLPVGEEWEGITDRFCRPCYGLFRGERERAAANVVADWVRTGRIALKLADAAEPFSPAEIVARGTEKAAIARRPDAFLLGSSMLLDGLLFLQGDGTWLPMNRIEGSWWVNFLDALRAEMCRMGWEHGDDPFREDLMVFLDDDRRMRVRLVEG